MSLSVIHFSDIHIVGKNDLILSRVEKLKAACASAIPSNGDVVIAITGDIAFSGKREQYDLAHEMLDQIAKYIVEQKSSQIHFVFVPGNHDCDFSKDDSIRKALIPSTKPDCIDLEYYNTVAKVQKAYFDFAQSYDIGACNILSQKEVIVDSNKVLFLLADTAWMSVIDETPGNIIIPQHLFEKTTPDKYKVVFYLCHHPDNWLNPDYKSDYINYIRNNADMVLVGHEHARDGYEKNGATFSVYFNHGKELQDSKSTDSAFTVINFDNVFQTYEILDFVWKIDKYERQPTKTNQFHKNIASGINVYHPNDGILSSANDIGITVNHFSKENVTLPDLFVWPDLKKCDFNNEKGMSKTIRSNISNELSSNTFNMIIGCSSVGKTALAKMLFLKEEYGESCCLLLYGEDFTSSDPKKINKTIEDSFVKQYSPDTLEDFRQLPKEKRLVIVDDFDRIPLYKNRRINVLDFLCEFFGRVTICMSSTIELPTILKSRIASSSDQLIYYDILPLGNKKRLDLITKWYRLGEGCLTEEEMNDRIDKAQKQINVFLGNGAAFVPAMPVFIIGVLQNGDSLNSSFDISKYGYLYESLILSSLSKISEEYTRSGAYNIDINVLSKLAFGLLCHSKTSFNEEQLSNIIEELSHDYMIKISSSEILDKMKKAQIIYLDNSKGDEYRFKYPYIFYYLSGRYIAHNLKEERVKNILDHMSSRLYIEVYGNIIIFVCHFANNTDVIDNILAPSEMQKNQ